MTGRGNLRLLQQFGPVALLLVLLLAALVSGLADHLSLEELRARGESLRELAHQRPLFSLVVYVALYVVTVSISLPGALIMSLSGGFLFGPVVGGAAAISGVMGGSTIVFLVSKSAFGTFIKAWGNPLLLKVEEGFREDAFAYLLTLRLIPAFPLLLVNIAAGLMNVPLRTFLTASILGVLPSSMIYAGIGSGLGHVFAQSGPIALSSLLSPQIYLPVIGMGALAFLPPLWRHWRRGRVAPASDVK